MLSVNHSNQSRERGGPNMTLFRFSLIFLVFNSLWTFIRGDPEIYCHLSRTCILPCTFSPGDEVVIHWIQLSPIKYQAHSYYHDADQLGLQSQEFKGRTSLYNDQLSEGNASLQLSNVVTRDQGRYQCYTSTIKGNKETFLQLKVYVPVEKVTIEKSENSIACRSDRIYPRPTLTLAIDSKVVQDNKPNISLTEESLYSISSVIPLTADSAARDYSCTVTTSNSKKTATLLKEAHKNTSSTEATIECQASDSPLNYLIWRFNHNQIILTKKKNEDYMATDEWKRHVKGVSDKGCLTLKDLTSDQEGTYTCESIGPEETSVASTVLHVTEDDKTIIIAVIVTTVLLGVFVMSVVYCKCRKKSHRLVSQSET